MKSITSVLCLSIIVVLSSCGGKKKEFKRNPVDDLIRDMHDLPAFSIILHDMDVVEGSWSDEYKQKYKIIEEKKVKGYDDSVTVSDRVTEWYPVNKEFFFQHEKNMGMAIATKTHDGKISKVAAPPGYNNYVGNRRYGSWNSSGIWAFYGQYAFMSAMLGMGSRPVFQSGYNTYRSSYMGRSPYYGGTSSNPAYGTNSAYNKKTNPNFFSRRASKSGWSSSSSRSSGVGTSRYNSSSSGGSRSYGK